MNTTTSYTIVPALFELNKFEVSVRLTNLAGQVISGSYLRNRIGNVRVFSTRAGARKAITRAIRFAAGETLALHR